MKLRHLLITIFFAFAILPTFGQVHLRITSLSRFPVSPTDTAYENRSYDSIQVAIQNTSNFILNNDNIVIYIVGNPALGVDSLYSDTALYTITPGTSTSILVPPYNFHPTHYDDGDNIVVVWPAARTTPYTCDSLIFHVYFVSLLANIDHPENSSFAIAPNPISDYIVLELPDDSGLKQVRIIDSLGRIMFTLKDGRNYIPTNEWSTGIYYLQYYDRTGKSISKKLVKS